MQKRGAAEDLARRRDGPAVRIRDPHRGEGIEKPNSHGRHYRSRRAGCERRLAARAPVNARGADLGRVVNPTRAIGRELSGSGRQDSAT